MRPQKDTMLKNNQSLWCRVHQGDQDNRRFRRGLIYGFIFSAILWLIIIALVFAVW
jgi:hypothetical protein